MRASLAILVAFLMIALPFAAAESEHEKEKDGKDEGRGKGRHGDERFEARRHIGIDISGQQAQIKMKREFNGTEDSIKIRYVANEGKMKVSFETENKTTQAEDELQVRFREVVEFRDANGNGALDDNETIVARHPIGQLDWKIVGPDDVNSSGTPGKRLSGIGRFPEGGALVFALSVFGDFANVNGTSLAPTDAKIDIILDHFPYKENDTQAALIVRSEQESNVEVKGGDAEMVAEQNGFAAKFSWAPNATVDNATLPVHTTVLRSGISEGEKTQTFALAYPRGVEIVHDPILGVESAGTTTTSTVPGAEIGIVVAVIGVAALVFGRKN